MSRLGIRVAAGMAVAMLGSAAEALDLHLRCDGVATFPEMKSVNTSVSGDVDLDATTSTITAGRVRDRLLIEVSDSAARVRLPRSMVPPLNSGGKDGWWPLSDLKIDDTEIEGKFRLNPLNKPTVRIDRVTGDVEVQGSFKLSFRGTCSVAEPAERRF